MCFDLSLCIPFLITKDSLSLWNLAGGGCKNERILKSNPVLCTSDLPHIVKQ